MKILLHEEVKFEYGDLAKRRLHRPQFAASVDSTPRAKGVHLSGVLRAIALSTEILTPSELDEEEESVFPLRMALGIAVEEFLASMYPMCQWWPGELKRDGVSGNMDGLGKAIVAIGPLPEDLGLCVEEIKYTHKSCSNGRDVPNLADRQGVKDWWSWLNQGMGYCNLHPAKPHLVRYHVIYGVGDYGVRPYHERYMRTLVEFSPQELEHNWKQIQKFKYKAEVE